LRFAEQASQKLTINISCFLCHGSRELTPEYRGSSKLLSEVSVDLTVVCYYYTVVMECEKNPCISRSQSSHCRADMI
jgi:hypothetical protein